MKIVSLLLIFFAAFIFSACAGHTWESPLKVVSALFYSDDLTSRLLTEWRLPRVITDGFTGALLVPFFREYSAIRWQSRGY